MTAYRCPTTPPVDQKSDEEPIIGCGEVFGSDGYGPDSEGLVDCPHCGIWFKATEPGVLVE